MMENEPFQRRVGTQIKNKWTLERLLGVGGMAAVYVGVHTFGQRKAIKILHPDIAADASLCARFEQEGKAVNRLRHPGAVEISDIDTTEDGLPFLVMELLEGSSLQSLIDQGHMPSLDTLLRLTDELLDVLAAAHAQGIVHRDIKPDNLFILSDGRLKVLDFGIARVRNENGKGPTRTGTTIGTVAYMSPEQVAGRRDLDGRADLFSVGATIFRVLAGRHVHEGEGEFELMVKVGLDAAPPLASVVPSVPAEVALVVDRALAFDRDQRYPDARTMQEDVRALMRRVLPPFASSRPPLSATPSGDPPPSVGLVVPMTPATIQRQVGPAPVAASTAVSTGYSPAAPPVSFADPRPAAPLVAPTVSDPARPASRTPPPLLLGLGALAMMLAFGGLVLLVRGLLGGADGAADGAVSDAGAASSVASAAGSAGAAGSGGAVAGSGGANTGSTTTAGVPPKAGSPTSTPSPLATLTAMPFPGQKLPVNVENSTQDRKEKKDKKDKKGKGD